MFSRQFTSWSIANRSDFDTAYRYGYKIVPEEHRLISFVCHPNFNWTHAFEKSFAWLRVTTIPSANETVRIMIFQAKIWSSWDITAKTDWWRCVTCLSRTAPPFACPAYRICTAVIILNTIPDVHTHTVCGIRRSNRNSQNSNRW